MSRAYEGNGLGLAIVKYYLRMTGARIEIRSTKDSGSVFTIVAPKDSEFTTGAKAIDPLFWSSSNS